MLRESRRLLVEPLHYWRTIALVFAVGYSVATIFHDPLAVFLATFAAAFIFHKYENRRWIEIPSDVVAFDLFLRLSCVCVATYAFMSWRM
jgi:hypothetical protein